MTVRFQRETVVAANASEVFTRSLDVDAHTASMAASGEHAVGGVRTGVMGLGDHVTWKAKHFGVTITMTSRIVELDQPHSFTDEQLRGPFKHFRHRHEFHADGESTRMVDVVEFTAPFGPLGWCVEKIFLGRYLQRLIDQRNVYLADM